MRVFLTGAAGLIGGELAQRLVARGHVVTAAVHRQRVVLGNDGCPAGVANAIAIELDAPGLGLDRETADRIARHHDLIIHCAATTRFDLPEHVYRAINVAGAAAVLALAAQGGLPVLYVSTAYVCGARNGPIEEDDPLPDGGFANAYEASKAEAEKLVAAGGGKHVIARPSIVVGDSTTGTIRCYETIYAAFKLVAEGHVRHLPASARATLDFVPIDYVAGGLVALAERIEQAAGGCFHLVSGAPVPVANWAAAIGSYPQFHAPDYVDPNSFDPGVLSARERRLFTRAVAPYASYFQRDPRFDDRRFRALTGLACPPTDLAFVRRLIDHCIAVGFLASANAHGDSGVPAARVRRTPTASRP